jgi:hypothetical protein
MNYKATQEPLNIWLSPLGDERIYLAVDGESLSLHREVFDYEEGYWSNDDFFEFDPEVLEALIDALQQLAGKQAARFCGGVEISGLQEPV